MHYRFPPARIFASVAGVGMSIAAFGLHGNWLFYFGWWPLAVIAGCILLTGGYWWWEYSAEERHASSMAKFARVNNWDFALQTPEYRNVLVSYPFNQGINHRDLYCIRGTYNGRRCASFTHEYDVDGPQNNTKKSLDRWQINVVELEYPLQTLDILPDDKVAKFAKFFGGMDIDFESVDFNKKWRVKGRNAKYAHDIVHPRMMERLLRHDATGMAIRIEGPYVIAWRWNRHGPHELARRLGVLTSIAKLIPAFVLREFEYEHQKYLEERRRREESAPDWATTPYALTSGKYTGIGAEDYSEEAGEGGNPRQESDTPPPEGRTLRPEDDEDREW